eukprot:2055562-Pleurochrysis_carterae.AAC.3
MVEGAHDRLVARARRLFRRRVKERRARKGTSVEGAGGGREWARQGMGGWAQAMGVQSIAPEAISSVGTAPPRSDDIPSDGDAPSSSGCARPFRATVGAAPPRGPSTSPNSASASAASASADASSSSSSESSPSASDAHC